MVSVNQTGWAMPGIVSCFTRICGSAKLWTMSLLERCTITGLVDRKMELVVELRQDDAAGRIRLAEQAADMGQRLARICDLPADDDDEAEAEQQEEEAG